MSFIVKYVDDFAGAMSKNAVANFEKELTGRMKNLRLKRPDESNDKSITFLDSMVYSDSDLKMR